MAKLLLKLGMVILTTLLAGSSVFAATGPATIYKVTVSKFELSSDGVNYITVFSGTSSELDIASASGSGQGVGNFMSGLSVPDGTYTHCKVTPSATFKISGNVGSNYTTASNGSGSGCLPGTQAQQAECTVTLTGGYIPTAQIQDFSSTPITVTEGVANRKIRVSFDVSAAISDQPPIPPDNHTELFPAQPTVTMTVQ